MALQNMNQNKKLLPEEQARIKINNLLLDAGWLVVSRTEYSDKNSAQAVKENLMKGNLEADYVLYLSGKAIAVIEAKRQNNNLGNKVKEQSEGYTSLLPSTDQFWIKPIPFVFISNGDSLLFKDMRDPQSEYEDLKGVMLTPRQLFEKLGIYDEFARLPAVMGVGKGKLRQCQHDAIENVELAFRRGIKKCLLDLATGSGKTFTACMLSYRYLTYTPAKRILYLVDRNNLGKQTFDEFNGFKLTEDGTPFTSIYRVERLKNAEQAHSLNVSICTIQRLFSVLTGQKFSDQDDSSEDENEELTFFIDEEDENETTVEVTGDIKLEKDIFDLIIIDECHRSIYGKWRKVLEYFSNVRIVGLTATPTPLTYAFFECCCDEGGNYTPTHIYSLEHSYIDGVNVPPIIYRIRTLVTDEGGSIHDRENVYEVNRRTGDKKLISQKNDEKYEKNDVDRSVVNPTQIRTVIETFRDKVFDELYPNRQKDWRYVPKTLIFAKTDNHAELIIQTVKDVFGPMFDGGTVPKNFVQKITHTQQNPNQLIKDLRNNKDFRIAVTVTLVATGTDVRPLEIVLFMRDIHSSTLYTQMKGRGCRALDDEKLKLVTPNADTKENYYLVDAVGVTESEKKIPSDGNGGGTKTTKPSLEQVLEWLAHGVVSDENLNYLAEKLSLIKNRTSEDHLKEFYELASIEMETLAINIFDSLEKNLLPPYLDINDPNNERKHLISKLIDNPKARKLLLELAAGFYKILIPGEDSLVYSGFSLHDAVEYTTQFENYVREHKDELEALKIIYNDEDKIITTSMLVELGKRLISVNPIFKDYSVIWNAYSTLSSNNKISRKVTKLNTKSEKEALTNLIQMIRFAFEKNDTLQPINGMVAKRFNLYIGQRLGIEKRDFTPEQIEVLKQLAEYVTQKGCVVRSDFKNDNQTQLMIDLVKIYTNPKLDEEITYFSKFILGITSQAA